MKNTYKTPPNQSKDNDTGSRYESDFDSVQADLKQAEAIPHLDQAAYYGIAGEIALAVGEKTEADSRGVLVGFLIGFGNLIGRTARFPISNDVHYPVEFGVVVGATSTARKGLGANTVEAILRTADPDWASNRIARSFSSGEGLLHYVRDARTGMVRVSKKDEPAKFEPQVVDPGVQDKRAFCAIGEFGEILIMLMREGNTLSTVLRNTWDCRSVLEVNTRREPIRATDAHVSIFGGITRGELLKLAPQLPSFDGFANRFLWVLVERSKYLPHGGPPVASYLSPQLERLRELVTTARGIEELRRSEEADSLWGEIYREIMTGSGRKVAERGEAHCLRLQMLYSLLDGSDVIETQHVEAAYALWKYCEECTRRLFRTEERSNEAQKILDYLQSKASEGATRTEISVRVFKGHRTQPQIVAALAELKGLVWFRIEPTEGRSIERWFAIAQPKPAPSKSKHKTKK